MTPLTTYANVSVGAGFGGVLRHILNNALPKPAGNTFPCATGSLAIGSVICGVIGLYVALMFMRSI